jgi:hypothetical protein
VASAQRVVVVEEYDGPRFRGGISAGAGGVFANGYGVGIVGLDGRLGVQVNNLIGIYAQPYLAGGGGSEAGGVTGGGLTTGVDGVIDFTFNRFFFGVGGGVGALVGRGNTDTNGQLLFRVGFYPILARRYRGARRMGLMVGADFRPLFITGVEGATVLQATGEYRLRGVLALGAQFYSVSSA